MGGAWVCCARHETCMGPGGARAWTRMSGHERPRRICAALGAAWHGIAWHGFSCWGTLALARSLLHTAQPKAAWPQPGGGAPQRAKRTWPRKKGEAAKEGPGRMPPWLPEANPLEYSRRQRPSSTASVGLRPPAGRDEKAPVLLHVVQGRRQEGPWSRCQQLCAASVIASAAGLRFRVPE